MIRVESLRAGYRAGFRRAWREVLKGVSFHVPKGSITGYLGVNGAGKTTTIKVLVGINSAAEGKVEIGGYPAGSVRAQLTLGYFPEAPFFYDSLNGLEVLDFYGRLSGLDRATRKQRSGELLEEVGLSDGTLPVRGYSKGMRQRLGLAQALIHHPEVLLLDEPLDGLDPMGRLHLRELIARQRDAGRTVFFSSHVLSDVEAVSDHLVVLDGGKIAYDGATEEIASSSGMESLVHLRFELKGELGSVLQAHDPKALGGDRYQTTLPDQASADLALKAIVEAEGRVLELHTRQPTLEETFLARFGQEGARTGPDLPTPAPAPAEAK